MCRTWPGGQAGHVRPAISVGRALLQIGLQFAS